MMNPQPKSKNPSFRGTLLCRLILPVLVLGLLGPCAVGPNAVGAIQRLLSFVTPRLSVNAQVPIPIPIETNPGRKLKSVSLSKTSVLGPATFSGGVQLEFLAPRGGTVVSLALDPPGGGAAQIPVSVRVLEREVSAKFDVVTFSVPANRNLTVRATAGGITKSGSFTVLALQLASLVIVPPASFGPFQAQGTVTLNLPAPANTTVSLTSSNPNVVRFGTLGSAQNTGTTTIQQNQNLGTFQLVASSVPQTTTVTVTARLNNGNTRSIAVTVRAL